MIPFLPPPDFVQERMAINGTELWVEVRGQGPPLVLVEGMGVGTWMWERQVDALAEHFRTVTYDLRGSGRSAAPPGPYSIAQMADDLAGVMDALGIESAHVLGVSFGGMVAQEYALTRPERVERLVLVSTTAGGVSHVPMTMETLALFMDATGTERERVRKKLPLAFTAAWLADEARVERMVDQRLAQPQQAHAFQAQAAAGAVFDASQRVSAIRAPTLVLAADADVVVPVENARYLAARIPGARLRVWEGLGHQFFVEAADSFNAEVITFLQSNPGEDGNT
jgi:pimeloyl-ACP methyl ester carboxylesterase